MEIMGKISHIFKKKRVSLIIVGKLPVRHCCQMCDRLKWKKTTVVIAAAAASGVGAIAAATCEMRMHNVRHSFSHLFLSSSRFISTCTFAGPPSMALCAAQWILISTIKILVENMERERMRERECTNVLIEFFLVLLAKKRNGHEIII